MAVFRARARTVDMLGRQQIAGIPTAISELFKNAHDAYADHVEVDFYRSDGLLVMRDDGIGMTKEEFEDRWLTLGTESKVAGKAGLKPPPSDPGKAKRAVLGEKGIGRLAIAAIGPQVMVLSRAKRPQDSPTVAAFINWTFFQLPGADLSQIEIPLRVFPHGTVPSAKDVISMVSEVRSSLRQLKEFADSASTKLITAQLDHFIVDPHDLQELLGKPSLLSSSGTQFIIQPADESLRAAIDGSAADADTAPPLLKTLVGFTNTMTPGHVAPVIRAAFRDHKTDEIADDLIGETEFFSPEEFKNADHHIEGRFNEFGQFQGTVTVYGEPTQGHVVPWPAGGSRTDCGPFRINLAVVQGQSRDSTMPLEEWLRVTRKLNRYGGLYIYRDGVRVLPYGNSDYDFLDIEENRTKSASYYYFSYRRIFGVIEIDRLHNGSLQEKAGREGFRENKAYRQFREILKNFFVQVAADFFREGGVRASTFHTRRAEFDRLERAKREREKQVSARRTLFRERLETVLKGMAEGRPARDSVELLDSVRRDSKVAAAVKDPISAANAFLQLESKVRSSFADLRERYRVVPPRGVGLPRAVRRDFEAYKEEFDRIVTAVFDPSQVRAEAELNASAAQARVTMNRRVRFERALKELTEQVRKASQAETQGLRSSVDTVSERATELVRESSAALEGVVRSVLAQAATTDVTSLNDESFVGTRRELENRIEVAAEAEKRALTSVAEQLRAITWPDSKDDNGLVTHLDISEAIEDELITLREQTEADLELAQLGMAIQTINHEFDATIKGVRRSLRELRTWADANEDLETVYLNIRRSFDHLDGYLNLFTPLQRRLYRKPVRMTGGEITKFLLDLFDERLRRHKVELDGTARFKRYGFSGYPASFYPVFVNLVDNAIFWLSRSSPPRRIKLDIQQKAMLVENTGPSIASRDKDAIFELGFTRKPGGRGLGLHISRQVLRREGYALEVAEPSEGYSVAFKITRLGAADSAQEEVAEE